MQQPTDQSVGFPGQYLVAEQHTIYSPAKAFVSAHTKCYIVIDSIASSYVYKK